MKAKDAGVERRSPEQRKICAPGRFCVRCWDFPCMAASFANSLGEKITYGKVLGSMATQ